MTHDEESMLIFAFRYALGRRTGAPLIVSNKIAEAWEELTDFTKRQLSEELDGYNRTYGQTSIGLSSIVIPDTPPK